MISILRHKIYTRDEKAAQDHTPLNNIRTVWEHTIDQLAYTFRLRGAEIQQRKSNILY